ncbi:MAG TPA: hypothetical protein DD401_03350, partial [Prevotella sp.]|nr:hypothetical protein [Prevotella sp.]
FRVLFHVLPVTNFCTKNHDNTNRQPTHTDKGKETFRDHPKGSTMHWGKTSHTKTGAGRQA